MNTQEMPSAEELFASAHQEMAHGSAQASIRMFRLAQSQAERHSRVWIDAEHMIGVAYRVVGDPEGGRHTLYHLGKLLSQRLTRDLDSGGDAIQRRGRVLRDLGGCYTDLRQFRVALHRLDESLRLLEDSNAAASELAATIHFKADMFARQGKLREALAKGHEALQLFSQDQADRRPELYFALKFARWHVLAGLGQEAKSICETYEDLAKELGKPIHQERLRLIKQHSGDRDAMEKAIAEADRRSKAEGTR